MKIEELIRKLKHSKSPVSLSDFSKVAKYFGYSLDYVQGSHYVFRSWTGRKFIVPVHQNRIKAIYMKIFLKEQE